MLIHFLFYGILGWGIEIFWTGLTSLLVGNWQLPGYTYLWMFPIYGLGVFLEPVHDWIRPLPWYIRGLIWMVTIFTIEYVMGMTLIRMIGLCPWDYSRTSPLHVNGVIRLDFIPAWFTLGLLFEKVHDKLDRLRLF